MHTDGVALPFRYAPPPKVPWTVLRPRLLRVLNRRFDVRLVTVAAGAGIGKTTLLSQAVEENRLDPHGRDVWLSLERADSSASTLAGSILRALGRPTEPHRVTTADDICDAIWDETPTPVCIILDDAHHLVGTPGGELLATLVARLPANGHLVLAGRDLPALPRARLLSQQQALAIVEADLRFTNDEGGEFAERRGVPAFLLDDTAGWPALAELRAAYGAPADREFLWEEVLAPLSLDDREAFLLIAAVGGGDADIVEAAAGRRVDIDVLEALPLTVSDDRGGLRPHALWADMARSVLDLADLQACRRRVGAVLRDRGDYGSAFELFADTDDWDAALETLFDACNDQRHPPWPDVVARWQTRVDPALADRPEVIYLDAYLARSADPWSDNAWKAFGRSTDAFRSRGDSSRAVAAEVRMLWSAWLRRDRDAIVSMDRRMFPDFTGRPGEGLLTNMAMLADIDGDTATLRGVATKLRTHRLEPRLAHFAGLHLVHADLVDGCASESTALMAAETASAGGVIAPAAASGWALLAPGIVAWARGALDEALAFDTARIGPQFSIAERAPALGFGAVRAAHLGRFDEAASYLGELRAISNDPVPDLLAGYLAVADATLAFARGDIDAATEALRYGLADRDLHPSGAGRAVLWFPVVPYLLDARCRDLLDARTTGVGRGRALALCRTLPAWRAGTSTPTDADLELLDDPSSLLAALPLALVVEIAARANELRDPRGRAALEFASERSPGAVRDLLARHASGPGKLAKVVAAVGTGLSLPPQHDVRIEVFGPLRMFRGGVLVTHPDAARERVRQLLLALVAHREIRRSRLGTLLWPDRDDAAVSSNLRMTLSYLQNLLEPDRVKAVAAWYLRQDAGVLRLDGGDHLVVDAWEVEWLLDQADLARAEATPSIELTHLLDALRSWSGEYLEDVAGEEWAEPLRQRVEGRLVRAALRCGELLLGGGRPDEAIAVAERALRAEKWSEAAYRLSSRAHLAHGDRAGALRTIAACRRMCAELGVEPERETVAIERSLMGEP